MDGGLVPYVEDLRGHPRGVGDAALDQEVEQVGHRLTPLLDRSGLVKRRTHRLRIRAGHSAGPALVAFEITSWLQPAGYSG